MGLLLTVRARVRVKVRARVRFGVRFRIRGMVMVRGGDESEGGSEGCVK